MNILNTNSYKIIFYIENLLREYTCEYVDDKSFNKVLLKEAEERAAANGVNNLASFEEYLKWLHLGELLTCISAKWFRDIKSNKINQVNVSVLIKVRNDIMHTRNISYDNYDEIKSKSDEIVNALDNSEYTIKWNRFISEEINNYEIPQIYIEYPLGRDFKKLIGRDNDLKKIKSDLLIPSALSIVGTGGIGKTALIQQLIEDIVFLPTRPFEKIYFMSFKDSVFENGKINRFKKVISNHYDLICKLAECMDINEENFKEKERKVWNIIFSSKSLVILDNLETEIVRSNLSEFTEIADMFMKNYMSQSRLIITSRFGLGDRERKYPLNKFDLSQTKELVSERVGEEKIKLLKVSDSDWNWIQEYGEGNPGLIIAFSDVLRNSNKKIGDFKIEYKTNYSLEGKQLNNIRSQFLNFCFENTIESLDENAQIYISIIAKFCLETGIYEINNEIIQYICSELSLDKRLGIESIKTIMLENVSFIQKKGFDEYILNELQVAFLSKDESTKVFNITKLATLDWYNDIVIIIERIKDMTYDAELSTKQLLARIYSLKYRETKENTYLLDIFMCEPSIENLIYYYSKINPIDVLNKFTLLEKCKGDLKNTKKVKEQHKLATIILSALNQVRELIKNRDIKDIRQGDLIDYFNQLKDSLYIFKNYMLNTSHRLQICKFLNSLGKEDESEKYLEENNKEMNRMAFVIFSKKFGNLVGMDREKCEFYMKKCEMLKDKVQLTEAMNSRYKINLARYYLKHSPELAFENAKYLDDVSQENDSIYSIYLESLLIRADCLIQLNSKKEEVQFYINKYEEEHTKSRYSKLYPSKKMSLQRSYDFIISSVYKRKKIL